MQSVEHACNIRYLPSAGDISEIKKVLDDVQVFYPYEIDVAIELLEDSLNKGDSSEYHFIFADDNGKPVGFICYGPITVTDGRYDIYWIVVDAKYQGKKIGSSLLMEAEKDTIKRGGVRIFIETSSRESYKNTRFFYRKNGYKVVSQVPDFYSDDDDKIIFMKILK